VLSGEKQRIERHYNFVDIAKWFATRCDLIFLLFDPNKLDISDEFKQVCGTCKEAQQQRSARHAQQASVDCLF
jgi:EH domain-containing protein 1